MPDVDKLPLADVIAVNLDHYRLDADYKLRWVYWWNSIEEYPHDVTGDQVIVQLNTDFNMSTMTAQELNAAVAAWQKGAMSRDTLFELFRRGEILPEGRTNEDEARLVSVGKPVEPAAGMSAHNFI